MSLRASNLPAEIKPATRITQLEEKASFALPVTRNEERKRRPVKLPNSKKEEKPPSPSGYHWRSNGSGWELRKTVYQNGRRRQPYIAHLSKEAFREMKVSHRKGALPEALAEWIRAREEEKGRVT